eukprot:3228938-Pyramimonas_sp.AAC.1
MAWSLRRRPERMAGSWAMRMTDVTSSVAGDGRLMKTRSMAEAVKSDWLKRVGMSDSISSTLSNRALKNGCCCRALLSSARRARCGSVWKKLFGGRLA